MLKRSQLDTQKGSGGLNFSYIRISVDNGTPNIWTSWCMDPCPLFGLLSLYCGRGSVKAHSLTVHVYGKYTEDYLLLVNSPYLRMSDWKLEALP